MIRRGGLGAILALLAMLFAGAAWAETITVTSSADSGAGSLRAAMTAANASATATTITFDAATDGTPIVLASALPEPVTAGGDLTITGNGAANTIIDGDQQNRPFRVAYQTLQFTLRSLTVRNGFADQEQGGALYAYGATQTVAIDKVAFVGNQATYGGGAIFCANALAIEDSSFHGNNAGTFGGALVCSAGQITIRNSTFADNAGPMSALDFSSQADARLVNVTVTGNVTDPNNAALNAKNGATLSMSNVVALGNSSFDLGVNGGATFDTAGSYNNVVGDPGTSGFTGGSHGNVVGMTAAQALLGPLGDYGGPTWTVPLLPGSPLIDAGTASGGDIPAADQRGLPRVGAPDVGSCEAQGFQIAISGGNNQQAEVDRAFAQPLQVTVTALGANDPVAGGQVYFAAPISGASAALGTADASIDAAGTAQTLAYANATVGGPYAVSASVAGSANVDFTLTNLTGECLGYAYPYTLSAGNNTARVAELRQAIDCANTNGLADVIDLDGQTLSFTAAYGSGAHGANALPIVTADLSLQHGTLQRADNAPAFRLLEQTGQAVVTLIGVGVNNGRLDGVNEHGGGMRTEGVLRLRNAHFEDNHAARGGAVYAAGFGNALVFDTLFDGNTAITGAAMASSGNTGSTIFVSGSRFTRNGSPTTASLLAPVRTIIVNSLIADNQVGASGGALIDANRPNGGLGLANVTIANNQVAGVLFGAQSNSGTFLIYNSILWGNTASGVGANVQAMSTLWTGPAPSGSHNINQAPGFVGAAGGNYQLGSGSPAIDAGNSLYSMPDSWDLDGDGDISEVLPDANLQPRWADDATVVDTGTPANNGPVIDMGAFERQTDSAAVGITVDPTSGLVTTEAGGTASFSVRLDRYPQADVSITLTSSDPTEGLVAPTSLHFTQANWNQPHTVTIIGVDDGVADGDTPYAIQTNAASSSDAAYAGMDAADVSVTNNTVYHAISGTVVGLLGSGLQITLNSGAETLSPSANGSFAFSGQLALDASYTVSITTQPAAPEQTCTVVNGSGSMPDHDVDNIIVNCGSSVTYRIGGAVSGLSGGGLVLQLNGGSNLAINGNGAYAFAPQLPDGASYVVTVQSQPQGQLCTLTHASGSVAGADVGNVDATCEPMHTEMHLSVSDGQAYTRYGQMRDYFVTLSNTGNIPATGFPVEAAFSAAFDVAHLHWQCISGGNGASCGSQGGGGFFDFADVPANGSVTWIVSVPVLAASSEPDATLTVGEGILAVAPSSLANAADAVDTNTLVLFRDGVDVPYADGTQVVREPRSPVDAAVLQSPAGLALAVPARNRPGIHTLRTIRLAKGQVVVQSLLWQGHYRVRLLARDADGRERASRWAVVLPGDILTLGSVAGPRDQHIILLEGPTCALQLGL